MNLVKKNAKHKDDYEKNYKVNDDLKKIDNDMKQVTKDKQGNAVSFT